VESNAKLTGEGADKVLFLLRGGRRQEGVDTLSRKWYAHSSGLTAFEVVSRDLGPARRSGKNKRAVPHFFWSRTSGTDMP
jgi:hypothetical protein